MKANWKNFTDHRFLTPVVSESLYFMVREIWEMHAKRNLEQFFSPGEKILNHGQISNEFSYKSMTQQFMQDCLEDLKTLDRLVPVSQSIILAWKSNFEKKHDPWDTPIFGIFSSPWYAKINKNKFKNAEIGQYLNGAVPGRADCNLASILFLLNLEEDTRIAKELKSSENLMSYLIRFESLVHRKESDPKLLELRIGSKPSNTQKYIAIGLTLCFLGVMFDLPKKIGRKLAKSWISSMPFIHCEKTFKIFF